VVACAVARRLVFVPRALLEFFWQYFIDHSLSDAPLLAMAAKPLWNGEAFPPVDMVFGTSSPHSADVSGSLRPKTATPSHPGFWFGMREGSCPGALAPLRFSVFLWDFHTLPFVYPIRS